MDHLNVNLGKLAYMDIPKWKQPAQAPPRRAFGSFERPAVELAVDSAAKVSSLGKLLKEIKDLGSKAAAIPVRFSGLKGPMIKPPSTGISLLTVGAGLSASAFAGLGVTAGTGVYGSNSPEFGVYVSAGGGYWSNAGASGGLQLTFIFGPPSSLAGVAWGVGIDLGIPGSPVGVGAMAYFSFSGPPFEFLGVSWGGSAGVSALPCDVTVQISETKLLPIPT